MKVVAALILALVGSIVTVTPAEAASVRRVTLGTPVVSTDGTAVALRGKVVGRARAVRIEVRRGTSSWQFVRKARVSNGRYAARLYPAPGTMRFRVVARERYSAARTVTLSKTAAKPATDACGTRPTKADGSLWACSFVDNFSGSTLDRTKWLPQVNFPTGVAGARACMVDDGTTVTVANGALNLGIRKLATPMTCKSASATVEAQYASGMVTTYHLFSQQYGRVEARIKNTATTSPGLQETFWLWPDDRVNTAAPPATGEIDVTETYSQYPTLSVPFLHGNALGAYTAYGCYVQRGVWNTYTLTWTASRLEIFVNGKSCLVNTSGDTAFQKSYIFAFTEALGVDGNAYDGRAPVPATMSIDYIRAWK